MVHLIVINADKLFLQSLNTALLNDEFKISALQITSSKDITTQIIDLIKGSNRRNIVLINCNAIIDKQDKQSNNLGIDIARSLLAHKEIRNKVSIIITSFLDKTFIEKHSGTDFSKTHKISYLRMPFSLRHLREIIQKSMGEKISDKELSEASKRFNLTRALECIRSTKHDIRNATLAASTLIRNVFVHSDSDEMMEKLIEIVRRDEGKKITWVDWFNKEMSSLPEKLSKLGFICEEDLPEQFLQLQQKQKHIDSYLEHFHLNEPYTKISDSDRKAIREEAIYIYEEFKSLNELFEEMADSLKRQYSS